MKEMYKKIRDIWEELRRWLILLGGVCVFFFVGYVLFALLFFCFIAFSNYANAPLLEPKHYYTEEDFNDYVGDAVRVDYQPRSWGVEEKWTVVTDKGQVIEKYEPVAEGQPVYER